MAFHYAVALTGGIATGKSTAIHMFKNLGFEVIDADGVAHQILDEQSDQIASLFGHSMIVDGQVDRKALGRIVFSDPKKKKELELLLHPLIFEEITRLSEELDQQQKIYFVDIPLFFETKRYPIERVVVVYVPKAMQLKRLMQRDGSSQEEAMKRIDAQMDIEQKRQKATYIIDNTTTLESLQEECVKIKQLIL